jgi:hypothetical protein
VEAEVRLDLVLWGGRNELIQRRADRLGACRVHPRRRQCRCLTFDSEPEVDHVEDVVV